MATIHEIQTLTLWENLLLTVTSRVLPSGDKHSHGARSDAAVDSPQEAEAPASFTATEFICDLMFSTCSQKALV